MKFDELNRLKRFFSTMEIPQSEKDKRVSLGNLLFDAFFYTFAMMRTEYKLQGVLNRDFYINSLGGRIRDVLDDVTLPYEEGYISRLTNEVVDTTLRHLDDDYYFSKERALLVAQNESNSVMNNYDYLTAKNNGKKYKTWIAELDNRTRPWHVDADGQRVPIDSMFYVGGEEMRFPHDYNASPDNIINCRCSCQYS